MNAARRRRVQPLPTPSIILSHPTLSLQSLAVNLTLDEYRHAVQASSLAEQLASSAAPTGAAGGGAAAPAASLSHLTITSADLDSMGLCTHCRYPCYLSGMPACEASHYLQMCVGASSGRAGRVVGQCVQQQQQQQRVT